MGDVIETRCPIGPGWVICVTGWWSVNGFTTESTEKLRTTEARRHREQRFVVVACRTSRPWAAHPPECIFSVPLCLCGSQFSLPSVSSVVKALLPRSQALEARVALERREGGIDAEPPG